jgi:hypothetical protein
MIKGALYYVISSISVGMKAPDLLNRKESLAYQIHKLVWTITPQLPSVAAFSDAGLSNSSALLLVP